MTSDERYVYIKKVIESCRDKEHVYTTKIWIINLHVSKLISDIDYLVLSSLLLNKES